MESQKIWREDLMLYGVHIFHTKQLTSVICNVPEIYGPVEADPWSESSASSESCPQTLRASILHPPVQRVLSACVRASSVLGCHCRDITQTLCGVSAEPGPTEGRRHTRNRTSCVYSKAPPQSMGWEGPVNCWIPPCHPRGAAQQDAGTKGVPSPPAGSRGSSSCCTSGAWWLGSPPGPRYPRSWWWRPWWARTACGQSSRSPPPQSKLFVPRGSLSRICWRSLCQVWLIRRNK